MDEAAKIRLIEQLHAIWNFGDCDIISDVYAENFIGHWPIGWGTGEIVGILGITESITRSRSLFPDWHEEIEDLFVSNDRVVSRYRSSGTPVDTYLGMPPTNKKLVFQEISIFRIENQKVAEQWVLADDLHCQQQLIEKISNE